jgi:hypothetical protein
MYLGQILDLVVFFMFREQLLIYCIVPLFILPAHYSIATVVSAIFL